ncbi:MAG: DUF2442 domain-containing protein [Sphingobacteriaceae bacterium]|nr:MAG: DUF2442 domain-containing protein [Sphingobacteriaceae bacterium]
MKAIQVKPLINYQLQVDFEDGISGKIDLSDLVQKGVFKIYRTMLFLAR